MMTKSQQRGVTLVELLIVVLILAALSTIAIPRISESASNAKAKSCYTNIDIINSAIEQYHHDTGSWPSDLEDVTKDKNYFPDGEPQCAVDGKKYSKDITSDNRLDDSKHNH